MVCLAPTILDSAHKPDLVGSRELSGIMLAYPKRVVINSNSNRSRSPRSIPSKISSIAATMFDVNLVTNCQMSFLNKSEIMLSTYLIYSLSK